MSTSASASPASPYDADAGDADGVTDSASLVSSSPTSVASSAVVEPMPTTWRERRRLSERKSRAKRKTNFELMRAQIEVLERAVANVPLALGSDHATVGSPSSSSSSSVSLSVDWADDETDRAMQAFLRRSIVLEREAAQLRTENTELAQLTRHHERSVHALRQLTRGMCVDTWSSHMDRWRDTTLATFTPWTSDACAELVRDSMQKIAAFSFDNDRNATTETTGLSFLGWRDRRRLDTETATIHFSFTKNYRDTEAEAMARGYWDMHMDPAKYARCMLGPNVQWYYEIVQHVSPDACIVRCVEQYPTVPFKIHMLFLTFRVRTTTGFVQCLRSVPCPELQRATLDEDAYWTTNFHWVRWDVTARTPHGDCASVRTSVNGSMASSMADYANRWMGEAILTLVRAESLLLGRSFLGL